MTDAGLAHVLSPLTVGPVGLRNRVVSTAHQTGLVHDHLPTSDLVAYHAERAKGGIGAVFVEASAVHPTGLLTAHTIGAYLPEVVPALAAVASAVRDGGGRTFIQLFHGGREQIASAPRPAAVAPSAVPTARFHVEPRALSRREIRELVAGYARSARHAEAAGLDGVEVSAAHGYLHAQFMSPRSNVRDDEYKDRLRFTVETLAAIRDEVGDRLAVGVRLSIDEMSLGSLRAASCRELAAQLCEAVHLDFVSFALGDSATHEGSSYIAPPPPVPAGHVFDFLGGVREELPAHVRVLAATRVVDLADAEDAVAGGLVDAVGMTRAHIAEPHLVRKTVASEPAIPCIGCNQGCIGHYHAGLPIACITNVRTGREATMAQRPAAPAVASGRSTLVVGGGPAGVTAAVAAAEDGDVVELADRASRLGGQLAVAGQAPGHAEAWTRWWRWSAAELDRLGVRVRLGAELAAADCAGYDRVVVATGARPYAPELPAIDGVRLVDAWTAIETPGQLSGPVLVADWGGDWIGLDAAETLASGGHQVTLAYAGATPGELVHLYQRNAYLGRLDALGVALLPHHELVGVDGRTVLRNVFSGRTAPLPAGTATVVYAHGRVPVDALWNELEGQPHVSRVGDACGPRGLEEATLEATTALQCG
ncbi:MAG: FAD-dependent oxidoreductase [Streptosporangiales bacterium]|nr:FAD-dependent oxidoreductase [Streptosporangiales bacterium]